MRTFSEASLRASLGGGGEGGGLALIINGGRQAREIQHLLNPCKINLYYETLNRPQIDP